MASGRGRRTSRLSSSTGSTATRCATKVQHPPESCTEGNDSGAWKFYARVLEPVSDLLGPLPIPSHSGHAWPCTSRAALIMRSRWMGLGSAENEGHTDCGVILGLGPLRPSSLAPHCFERCHCLSTPGRITGTRRCGAKWSRASLTRFQTCRTRTVRALPSVSFFHSSLWVGGRYRSGLQ